MSPTMLAALGPREGGPHVFEPMAGVMLAIKALALIFGIAAAGVGWWAAHLWFEASRVQMPPYDPPLASAEDNPAIHILCGDVRLNQTTEALEVSGALNASAARWTAWAAVLGGAAVVLGAL